MMFPADTRDRIDLLFLAFIATGSIIGITVAMALVIIEIVSRLA